MRLDELCKLAVSGVYAFINEKEKRIYVGQSNNVLYALNRSIERFKMNAHECVELQYDFNEGLLEYTILETEADRLTRLVKAEHYKSVYENDGYNLYPQRKLVKFDVRIKIETIDHPLQYKAIVYLNTNRKHHILGIFDTIDEANEFVKLHYTTPLTTITYAKNNLTLNYLSQYSKDVYRYVCRSSK